MPVRSITIAVLIGVTLLGPPPVAAQDDPISEMTPAELLEEARDRQEEFERLRISKIPVERVRGQPTCDELIGTICIWFGGEDETGFPAEWEEVGEARVQLIAFLLETAKRAPDRWVTGQLVYYLIENRDVATATQVAADCGIPERWWCAALEGYILHLTANYIAAEDSFREALDLMPPEEREEWLSPRFVLTTDGVEMFAAMDPAERDRKRELFWRLSDPLFVIEGNDRLTDHFARIVESVNWRDSANPMGMGWNEFMEATQIRYGRNIGYSRTYDPIRFFQQMGDTRQVLGHHHPKSRGYLFPEEFLESPSDVPPESWITAPREARTWFAPRYAPEMRPLETQVGRFRRGDEMLVVGAYRPIPPPPVPVQAETPDSTDAAEEDPVSDMPPLGPFGIRGVPASAFFLIPEDGSEPKFVRDFEEEGVLTITTEPGRYVSGLEVVDLEGKQAWRARQGVVQLPLVPGLVDVSDLLILREGVPLPESLEEAIPNVRPGVRIRQGERFPIVWEAYGLRINEPVRITLGFTTGRPGFLTRVGEFLGIVEPDAPVDLIFEDRGPDSFQTLFRAIEFELPDLEPGEYTLHLKVELTGREEVVRSRPIIVE